MSVTFNANNVIGMLQHVKDKLKNLPQETFKEFVKVTPVKTGNARRKTKLVNGEVHANYAYAEVLDKGRHMTKRGMRGSEQAPRGMSKPTIEFVRKRVSQIVKGK